MSYPGSCFTLALNSTSYGYLDAATGNLIVTTTGFPVASVPIFTATTDSAQVIRVTDSRVTYTAAPISGVTQVQTGTASPGIGFPARFMYVFGDSSGTFQLGTNNAPVKLGTSTGSGPTATEPQGNQFVSAASASTNVVAGVEHNLGGSNGSGGYSYGTVSRYSARLLLLNSSNVRYWIGIGDGNAGDWGGASSTYATDQPARYYTAFRFSSGTDTTIKAICSTGGASQTIVDTGVAPDTANSMLFEIVNSGATSFAFYINGALVATITTTLPSAASKLGTFWAADNKNTATSVGAVFYWSETFYVK